MEDSVQDIKIWKENMTKFMWLLITAVVGLGFKVVFDFIKGS